MPAVAADGVVVMVALVAILVVLAVYFLLQAIIAFCQWIGMPNWPLIGGTMFNAISGVGRWVLSVENWLWAHANPAVIITATVHWLLNEMNTVNSWVAQNVVLALGRVVTVTIPSWFTAAQTLAWTLYDDALAFVSTTEAVIGARITAVEVALEGIIATGVADARAWASQLYGDAIAYVDGRVAAAEAAALGLVQSLQGWALQEFTAIRTWVTGEIGAAEQTLQGDIGTAVQGVEATLSPAIAAAAAAATAAAAAFQTWKADCGDPLCSNLNGFGNIISQLEGLISDGLLIALIAGAVSDPAGTVNVIEQDFAQPVTDAVSTVLGAVGFNLQRAA